MAPDVPVPPARLTPPPAPRRNPATTVLERRFVHPGEPPPVGAPRPRRAPRDLWLRLTLYCTLLGAVLTMISAWMRAGQDHLAPVDAAGLASYHQILVPLLSLAAMAGVLMLERAAAAGMTIMLLATGLGLGGGAAWLLPGLLLACIWAARHHHAARVTLGFLLLLPGIAAGYYGILGSLSFLARVQVTGLPPSLSAPLTLTQALAPLELLPLALLGAWLLIARIKLPAPPGD